MRLKHGSAAGLAAALLLLVLSCLFGSKPAVAAEFDCARASLQVDFVICRSEDGRRAIANLTAAWEKATSVATADRKTALLDQQRRWIGVYQLMCGLGGRGRPAIDPTQRIDRCVVEQLRQRKNVLESIAASIEVRGRDGPYTFLYELYGPYESGGSTVILDSNADLYFAPILAKAFQTDQAESKRTNSPRRFDGDALVRSQEQVRVSGLQIQAVTLDSTHARGVLSYHLSESAPPTTLTIDLIHTERGWRVADIFYPSTASISEASLLQILSGVPLTAPTPECAFQPVLNIDARSAMKAGDWLPISWSNLLPSMMIDWRRNCGVGG